MEAILALAACALLAVQAQRNYLIIKGATKPTVDPVIHITVQPAEVKVEPHKPVVHVDSDLEIDYTMLGKVIEQALIKAKIAEHNAGLIAIPATLPVPNNPQLPIVSGETSESSAETIQTASGVEVPVKKF